MKPILQNQDSQETQVKPSESTHEMYTTFSNVAATHGERSLPTMASKLPEISNRRESEPSESDGSRKVPIRPYKDSNQLVNDRKLDKIIR